MCVSSQIGHLRLRRDGSKSAVKAGLSDLGVRMRNEVARNLEPSETIVEDEPVLVGDAQGLTTTGSDLGKWGWIVLTSKRAIWAAFPDKANSRVLLSDLDLVFSEDDRDTYRWQVTSTRRKKTEKTTISVTLGFVEKSEVRDLMHEKVNDARHGSS